MEYLVETSDEWLQSRTGIRERRKVQKGEATVEMSTNAVHNLLNNHNISDIKDILKVDSIKYLTLDEVLSVIPDCYCEFFGGGISTEITSYGK